MRYRNCHFPKAKQLTSSRASFQPRSLSNLNPYTTLLLNVKGQNVENAPKAVLRPKFITASACVKKGERFQMKNLNFLFKELEKKSK